MNTRGEQDSLGSVDVPKDAYYGAQTRRAELNFPVSHRRFPPLFITTLARIKRMAAEVNRDLGLLASEPAAAIITAASEIVAGEHLDQFVVDVFQTGSGTSTNMNMNEVIAGRANELLTGRRGGRSPVHPNDHVNLGQSSNDVIPSTIHLAALTALQSRLLPALRHLHAVLDGKSAEFAEVRKIGRTHLQDAVPLTLGQEFGGYARQVALGIERIERCRPNLAELALGGTAVGSGLNAHAQFAPRVIARLAVETGCPLREAENHFAAQAAQDAAVETSGALKTVAVSLMKIANDIRWLGSGPRCGLGELKLPALQPGSSIMPGKVNPVIPEVVVQVAAQVLGNDLSIALGAQWGFFELNTMLPLIAHNLLESIQILGNAATLLADRCLVGLEADRDRCAAMIERSLAMATHLVPVIGYDRAAELAKEAYRSGRTVRETALAEGVISAGELERLLGPVAPSRSAG